MADISLADAEFTHLLLKILSVHSDTFGGARNIATGGAQCAEEEVTLPSLEEFLFGLAKGRHDFTLVVGFWGRVRSAGP